MAEEGSRHTGGNGHGMGDRGVSRPTMGGAPAAADREDDGSGGGMTSEDRRAMLAAHHEQTLWAYWLLVALGVWLLAAPATFGYGNEALWVRPAGGRGVWFGDALHTDLRARLVSWSDLASGVLLVVFGWRSLRPDRPLSRWVCCFVGIWLTLAPVVLWAPTAAAYLNDTVVGMLAIALSVLIPGMPNMILYMKMGPPTPPGWSYNPSSWPQRWIMIVLAFAGFLASRYLAAFQLGFTDAAWDPFFGEQSRRVLNSEMSHMWPVSDAALGTFAYTLEFLMGWMGAPTRWRTMPWMVAFFGILVIPLGLVHIFLVISQPVLVGAWCTFCLLAAALMLPMIPLQVDEVVAMVQHVARANRRGERLWSVFWKGGDAGESGPDERSPGLAELPERPGAVVRASLWGMSAPWTLAASAGLGIWLMFAPGVLGIREAAAHLDQLGGALAVVVAVIAMGEPVRAARYLNVPLGLAVAVLPWMLDGSTLAGSVNGAAVGLLIAALAVPRGRIEEDYGSWNRFVR